MMTLDEYSKTLHDWCADVEAAGVELFKSGCAPSDCTGIAINIVESRRRKKAVEPTRLAIPAGVPFTRQ